MCFMSITFFMYKMNLYIVCCMCITCIVCIMCFICYVYYVLMYIYMYFVCYAYYVLYVLCVLQPGRIPEFDKLLMEHGMSITKGEKLVSWRTFFWSTGHFGMAG